MSTWASVWYSKETFLEYPLKNARSDYYLSQITDSLNDPRRFWQTVKSLSANSRSSELPPNILVDSIQVSNKSQMLNCFNKHFIASSSLFGTLSAGKSPENFCTALFIDLSEAFLYCWWWHLMPEIFIYRPVRPMCRLSLKLPLQLLAVCAVQWPLF